MVQHYTVTTFRDIDGEESTFQLPNGPITALTIAGFLTEYGSLKTALDALTLGVLARDQWVGDKTEISSALPTNNFAQRELKLKFTMIGAAGGDEFYRTLPCPDLAAITIIPDTGGTVDITAGTALPAAITAIETLGKHPDDPAEAITVTKVEVVGRNI